ncbi:MAG TPA: hypothetical protein VJV78_18770 [Polyangiales bacterium]|nr:hypothetical protein [Polyangiales bacterium]
MHTHTASGVWGASSTVDGRPEDFALHLTEGSASTTTIVKLTRHRKALYTKTIE